MKGRRISYSAAELAFIETRKEMNRAELCAAFVAEFSRRDVTPDNIKALCTRKGWDTGRQERWTAAQDAVLIELYPDHTAAEVAERIGRAVTSVWSRAQALGLHKSESFLESPKAGRLDGIRGTETRFKKGSTPSNKGLRRPGFAPGRMSETQFKKGEPTNWHPIGSLRVISGYEWTKVSDERDVVWTTNWRQTHILRWEQANGPILDGHRLKCLDGNTLNTDPSNWDCVPMGVLPRLNGRFGRGYEKAPAELKPTIMALAKLEHAARRRA